MQAAVERRMKRLGATERGPEIVMRMKRFAATRVPNWGENKQVQNLVYQLYNYFSFEETLHFVLKKNNAIFYIHTPKIKAVFQF